MLIASKGPTPSKEHATSWYGTDRMRRLTLSRVSTLPWRPLWSRALVIPKRFRSGRDFSAWIGLVPKQNSSGCKDKLGNISQQGEHTRAAVFAREQFLQAARRSEVGRESSTKVGWADEIRIQRVMVRSDGAGNAPTGAATIAGSQGTVLFESDLSPERLSVRCAHLLSWQTTLTGPEFIRWSTSWSSIAELGRHSIVGNRRRHA
jgi:hypothetical protein